MKPGWVPSAPRIAADPALPKPVASDQVPEGPSRLWPSAATSFDLDAALGWSNKVYEGSPVRRAPSGGGDILGGRSRNYRIHFTDEEIGAQKYKKLVQGHSEYVPKQDLSLECLCQ